MEKNIVLVTGGTGLVGHGIQKYVEMSQDLQDWATWIFVGSEFDFRNTEQTIKCFETYHPTHVIHLAARVGGLFVNMKYKVEFFRENILIDDNIMEQCRVFSVKKLVSCLSTCIFPDKTTYPIDETMVHLGPPHVSNEGYAYAKRLIDVMSRCYREEYGCNFTSVIPTNVFGTHDNYSFENGHVIPSLIHRCYLALRNRTDFVVQGSGKPMRQFIYNLDLAKLMVWVLREYDHSEPLILSCDEKDELSIGKVARVIAKTMGLPESRLIFEPNAPDGQFKKTASNRRLRQLLPDFQFTPIEEAMKVACDWFVQNYPNVRGSGNQR